MGIPLKKNEFQLGREDQVLLRTLLDDCSLGLSNQLREVLASMLEEAASGHSLTIIPSQQELSSQEAAEILRVSRMYLIKLLDEKKIPHRLVGKHRRVMAADLMNYKSKLDEQRREALTELARLGQETEEDY